MQPTKLLSQAMAASDPDRGWGDYITIADLVIEVTGLTLEDLVHRLVKTGRLTADYNGYHGRVISLITAPRVCLRVEIRPGVEKLVNLVNLEEAKFSYEAHNPRKPADYHSEQEARDSAAGHNH